MSDFTFPDDVDRAPSPPMRPMAAREVFTILQDVWRQQNGIDADAHIERPLTGAMTIEAAVNELGVSRMFDDWPSIARFLDDIFRTDASVRQWEDVAEAKRTVTLDDICEFIAQHAQAPLVQREFGDRQLSWQAAMLRSVLLVLRDARTDIEGWTLQ